MSVLKGYSSSFKDSGQLDHLTMQKVFNDKIALDVISHSAVTLVAADAIDSIPTSPSDPIIGQKQIVAAGHVAKAGMVIQMTSGNTSGEIVHVRSVDASTIYLGQRLSQDPAPADTFEIYRYVLNAVSSSGSITVTSGARTKVENARHDYSSVNVTTVAYTQLIASTSAAGTQILLFDSSGETMILAVGPAAGEVDQLYIFPGGFSGPVDLGIPAGSRVSVKALSNDATVGEITLNILG